ncbi:MAG: hypothetical protein M1839_004952 [Geoglossum umbratile]|nr:MAG: hypothetical protein M1839_004952 [Geoglossum umbratile]
MKHTILLCWSWFSALTLAQASSCPELDSVVAGFPPWLPSNSTTDKDRTLLSHIVGVVQTPATVSTIGPNFGAAKTPPNTWTLEIPSSPVADTKYMIFHFTEVSLPGNNRIEVDLGYDTDTFKSASGSQFWTRPINVRALAGAPVVVRYITDGATTGGARLDKLGIGQRHAGEQDPTALSNCDPFIPTTPYVEPKYDPFWYCAEPPNWENVACVTDSADVRARVARSVGMIITPEGQFLSTCSVTLIDSDQVILAGHCFPGKHESAEEEALSSSITFDYQTDCAGNRVPSYNPKFYKVKKLLDYHYFDGPTGDRDFSRLLLDTAPTGVPPLQLRPDLPGVGEQVFGIHHPNGAVKKLSIPHPGFATVAARSATAVRVPTTFHVSGGSSGSSLFDTAGRVLGVLSNGDPCGRVGSPSLLKYYPASSILQDLAPAPATTTARDVMIVFDRSGSMSELDATSRTKIEVARDAVSLFVQLIRAGVGNRVGLVSFSTKATSPVDFPINAVNAANKQTLIGSAPFAGGITGALAPGGATSIGEGLDQARLQFPGPGTNPRAILLMTDGMQNTPRFISDVESALTGIEVHAVGFGKPGNLDSALLMQLTSQHQGLYAAAETGVALQKFFSHAFGNIFETGLLKDPEFDLPADQESSAPLEFNVCGESAITVAVGWDNTNATLRLNLTTPGGATITGSSSNVEESSGRSWTFLRVPLPYGGERQGKWKATVFRPRQSIPIVPRASLPPLHYFINVIPTGGPSLVRVQDDKLYYTGDTFNPLVFFRFPDGSWAEDSKVQLTFSRPNASIGTILSRSGLHAPFSIGGDTIPARQATLRDLGVSIKTVEETFELSNTANKTKGLFEDAPLYGKPLVDKLIAEGTYLLHFRASFGGGCAYTRELIWSLHVDVGIDPSHTDVSTTFTGTGPNGQIGIIIITPRDKYGNDLGPGRSDGITISGSTGTIITGTIVDIGNGSYTVPITWDPATGNPPGVVIGQPGRPPVIVQQPGICKPTGPNPSTCPKGCSPISGVSLCHQPSAQDCVFPTASAKTPYCACRAGYKSKYPDDDTQHHWRVNDPGQIDRVWVAEGVACDVLCKQPFGTGSCREVTMLPDTCTNG